MLFKTADEFLDHVSSIYFLEEKEEREKKEKEKKLRELANEHTF